jgi:hypothetical protein
MNSHIAVVMAAERACDIQEDVARGSLPRDSSRPPRRTMRERVALWRRPRS